MGLHTDNSLILLASCSFAVHHVWLPCEDRLAKGRAAFVCACIPCLSRAYAQWFFAWHLTVHNPAGYSLAPASCFAHQIKRQNAVSSRWANLSLEQMWHNRSRPRFSHNYTPPQGKPVGPCATIIICS
jgi:hypothetical protein